jgi:hypothetical protein
VNEDDPDQLISPAQAAARHGLAEGYVRRQIDSGALPVENAGSRRVPQLRVSVLDTFMSAVRAGFAAERVARGW